MKQMLKNFVSKTLKLFPLKNIIIFESNSDFCDNSRAIFEYLIDEKYNVKYRIV